MNIPSGWRHLRKPPCVQTFNISGRSAWMLFFFCWVKESGCYEITEISICIPQISSQCNLISSKGQTAELAPKREMNKLLDGCFPMKPWGSKVTSPSRFRGLQDTWHKLWLVTCALTNWPFTALYRGPPAHTLDLKSVSVCLYPRCEVRSLWTDIRPRFLLHFPVGKRLVSCALQVRFSFHAHCCCEYNNNDIFHFIPECPVTSQHINNTSELLNSVFFSEVKKNTVGWFWQICAAVFDVCCPPTPYGPLHLSSQLCRRNRDGGKIPDIHPTS